MNTIGTRLPAVRIRTVAGAFASDCRPSTRDANTPYNACQLPLRGSVARSFSSTAGTPLLAAQRSALQDMRARIHHVPRPDCCRISNPSIACQALRSASTSNDNNGNNDEPSQALEREEAGYTEPVPIRMPHLDLSMDGEQFGDVQHPKHHTRNRILKWYKRPGDIIRRDDTLCDIETPLFTFGMVIDDDDHEESIMGEIHVPASPHPGDQDGKNDDAETAHEVQTSQDGHGDPGTIEAKDDAVRYVEDGEIICMTYHKPSAT
eukprot:CAMPEP_0198126234 /NCGR_PEP_ID=MMETSP1442-20131203/44334_1 /TAXON_ID= /ORGANISM="Craspedostauros australis, Strain CCMP3328" /LENGTH=262 /DNA_ID=CAMNT_0043785983 /DNA_START=70 /DNA_END=858 /DNA_ORIENTATION=-